MHHGAGTGARRVVGLKPGDCGETDVRVRDRIEPLPHGRGRRASRAFARTASRDRPRRSIGTLRVEETLQVPLQATTVRCRRVRHDSRRVRSQCVDQLRCELTRVVIRPNGRLRSRRDTGYPNEDGTQQHERTSARPTVCPMHRPAREHALHASVQIGSSEEHRGWNTPITSALGDHQQKCSV